MTCEHCKNRVMEVVNFLTGASADVKLKKGIVLVSYENEIEDTVIISDIEKSRI